MVALTVGVQDGVRLPPPDGAVALHQIKLMQVRGIVCKCPAKVPEFDPRSKIEASKHVKHDLPHLSVKCRKALAFAKRYLRMTDTFPGALHYPEMAELKSSVHRLACQEASKIRP